MNIILDEKVRITKKLKNVEDNQIIIAYLHYRAYRKYLYLLDTGLLKLYKNKKKEIIKYNTGLVKYICLKNMTNEILCSQKRRYCFFKCKKVKKNIFSCEHCENITLIQREE